MTPRNLLLSILSLVGLALLFTGCNSLDRHRVAASEYDANPTSVVIPDGVPPEAVEQAMVSAFMGRGWRVRSRSQDEVVGTLVSNRYDSTVTMQRKGGRIVLLSDTYLIDKDGERLAPTAPKGWVKFLSDDLNLELRNY